MNQPKNVHDALRHIDNLLADILRTIDAYTEERLLANIPEQLKEVCGSAADARLLAVWVRGQLNVKE
jgi:hypothetical protein